MSSSAGDDALEPVRASVVIINHNNEAFLQEAIDSALQQTYACEVLVVDDGSTDDSMKIARSYGAAITLISQVNSGQASAMDAGYNNARGDLIFFLDADDAMFPDCIQKVADQVVPGASTYMWFLDCVDVNGQSLGDRVPGRRPESGRLRSRVSEYGPSSRVCPPTSGMAFDRAYLNRVMPLPTRFRTFGDTFLMDTAPLFGEVVLVDAVLGRYRIHQASSSQRARELTQENLQRVVELNDERMRFLVRFTGEYNLHRWDKWRHLCVRALLARLRGHAPPATLRYVRAARRAGGSPARRLGLLVIMLAVRRAPLPVAQTLARRVLRLQYM